MFGSHSFVLFPFFFLFSFLFPFYFLFFFFSPQGSGLGTSDNVVEKITTLTDVN